MWQKQNSKKHLIHKTKSSRYASRNYANPYFKKRKRLKINWPQISISRKQKIFILLFSALVLALFALSVFSNIFFIKNLDINGSEKISEDQIKKIIENQKNNKKWLILNQKNLLFFDLDIFKTSLEAKYAFENLSVNKKFPDTIKINFTEKSYALIWQEDDLYYYADNTGHVLEEANLLEIGERDYPIITNETGVKTLGTKIEADTAYISQVLQAFRLAKEYNDIVIERFIKDNDKDSLKIKLKDGPYLYLDINSDLGEQLDRVIIIKNEKLKQDFANKEYIDVRFGNSVYYK
jgi:cell division septal protein FtsQ